MLVKYKVYPIQDKKHELFEASMQLFNWKMENDEKFIEHHKSYIENMINQDILDRLHVEIDWESIEKEIRVRETDT